MPQVHTPKTFGQRLATRALGMLRWKAVLEPPHEVPELEAKP